MHEMLRRALDLTIAKGETLNDEARFAEIEACLRDFLGQNHDVRNWRLKPAVENDPKRHAKH